MADTYWESLVIQGQFCYPSSQTLPSLSWSLHMSPLLCGPQFASQGAHGVCGGVMWEFQVQTQGGSFYVVHGILFLGFPRLFL